MQSGLQVLDMAEVLGFEFTVRRQSNPPKVKIVDEKLIPETYKSITTTVNISKRDILDDLKEGKNIPGVDLERTERLVIKPTQRKLK
jgi:hypothetical protein